MAALMMWSDVSDLEPYPWAYVDCPECGETELARDITRPFTGFVCMNCGAQTTIEVRFDGEHGPEVAGLPAGSRIAP